MEFFSVISELSQFPINVITSLFGVPVILMMILKKNRIKRKGAKGFINFMF